MKIKRKSFWDLVQKNKIFFFEVDLSSICSLREERFERSALWKICSLKDLLEYPSNCWDLKNFISRLQVSLKQIKERLTFVISSHKINLIFYLKNVSEQAKTLLASHTVLCIKNIHNQIILFTLFALNQKELN